MCLARCDWQLLERETRREKILEGRAKEKKLAQKQVSLSVFSRQQTKQCIKHRDFFLIIAPYKYSYLLTYLLTLFTWRFMHC